MNTCPVALGLALVTGAAVYRLRGDIIIGVAFREIGVTGGAGVRLVRRGAQLLQVNEQGNLFASRVGLAERLVRVAVETIAVFQSRQRRAG